MDEHVANSAFLKAEQIREQAIRLRSLSFPSDIPVKFIVFMSRLCEQLKRTVERRADDDPLVQWICIFLVDKIAPMLSCIEGSTSSNTPATLVAPLQEIGETALPGSKFIVSRQWRYNYSVLELRRILEPPLMRLPDRAKWKALFEWLQGPLYVIWFPSFERDNALLHVSFAHEIGHSFEEDFLSREEETRALNQLRQEIDREAPQKDVIRRAEVIGRATSLRRAAIREMISDAISAHVFGPSALFALQEVAGLSESMDEVSQDLHPPWRFRLRHMLSALQELGFVDNRNGTMALASWPEDVAPKVKGVKAKIDGWLDKWRAVIADEKDWERLNEDTASRYAYRSVERAKASIRAFAKENVKNPYVQGLFRDEVPPLLERLYLHLPPNQIEAPNAEPRMVNTRSILASGWLYKLAELASTSGEEFVKGVNTLNRLVLKAFELRSVKEEFDSKYLRKRHGAAQ
jgi:hypothetical protein